MSPVDPEKAADVSPVTISIVGTGNGTGGGVAPTPNGTVAQTPKGQPNLLVNVITPGLALLIRFLHEYGAAIVGLVAAGMTPAGDAVLDPTDFWHLVKMSAGLALPVPAFGLIKNIVTIFGRLEGKFPLLTGSI